MMTIVAAAWRVVLKRTVADWLILLAAFITILLATTLLSAGPIYAGAVTLSGVRRTLHDAPVRDANVEISARIRGPEYPALDNAVVAAATSAFQTTGGPIYRSGRSESFALPGQDPDAVRDLAVFAFYDLFDQHVDLVAGAWPQSRSDDGAPIQTAISEQTATLRGLKIGDTLNLQSRREPDLHVDIVIAGIYRVRDRADPFWWEDPLALDGVDEGQAFVTYGPFVTTITDFLGSLSTSSSEVDWRVYPIFDNLTVNEVSTLRSNVENLDPRINFGREPNDRFQIETDLDGILRKAERSLLVTRSGVLILTVQLAILAGYALLLTAGLLIEQRRIETALLRSRGGDNGQVAMMALMEGLLLAVPAAVLGPWIAAVSLRILNLVGPLAAIDLELNPVVTRDAYALAVISAMACVAALVFPALQSARLFVEARSARGRQMPQGLAQRAGIDLALLVVAALAYWQLRRYGAPITETVQGRLGLDPFLIAAPAIGLLAGAVVALRFVPLLARVVESLAVRRRGLVPSLGAWQLARRPLRYARSALLLMLALAIGLFAVSYNRTWTLSQQDQADYQIGGDIRLRPDIRFGTAIPMMDLAQAQQQIPGVEATLPVVLDSMTVSRSAGSGDVLAIDAARASSVINFRDDLASEPLQAMMQRLADQRPVLASVPLPGQPQRLALDVRVTLDTLPEDLQLPPDAPTGIAPAVSLVVQDADGMLYRMQSAAFQNIDGDRRLEMKFAFQMSNGQLALPQYPLSIVSVELRFYPLQRIPRTGLFEIVSMQTSDALMGEAWNPVALPADPSGWSVSSSMPVGILDAPQVLDVQAGGATALAMRFSAGSLVGSGPNPITFSMDFGANQFDQRLPALVNDHFLEVTESRVGDTIPLDIGRDRRQVVIAGLLHGFPTLEPDQDSIIVVDLPSFAMLEFAADTSMVTTDEWWLAARDNDIERISAALSAAPYSSPRVDDRIDRGRTLRNDPVALGIIGALSLGFIAAGLFAGIGFAVSAAVSARERLTEFALLRALGLSTGQLSSWLSLENGLLVAISLAGGTALGLLLAWLVLPLVSLTQAAAAVVPGVIVVIPWGTVLILEGVTLAVLVVVVVVLAGLLRRLGLGSVLRLGGE